MFLKTYSGWKLENTKLVELKCDACNNTSEHYVYVHPYGPQLGLIFLKKPLLTKKQYFLACPICRNLTVELTEQQAMSLKEQGQ
jgi:Zn finger protein HypA/HybF involved in hydrogenase expression